MVAATKGKRIILCLLLAALLMAFASPAAAEADLAQLVKDVEPAVLFIVMYDRDGDQYGLGSGFFISPEGEFLTNRHVLKDAFSAVAVSPSGRKYPVTKVVAIHPEADIVKATVGNVIEPVPFLRISRDEVVKGQRIFVFGNPKGLSFTVSDGIVSGFRKIGSFGEVFQMTAPISPGSSGGPVVNAAGEVVGVSVGHRAEGQNLNFAVRAKAIDEMVTPSGGPLVLNPPGDGQKRKVPGQPPKRPTEDPKRYMFVASYPEYDTYIDLSTLMLVHNKDTDKYRVEFWVKSSYKPAGKARMIETQAKQGRGEKFFNFSATLTHIRFTPDAGKFSLLRLIHYDDRGKIIEAVDFKGLPLREETPPPGSLIEKAIGLAVWIIKEYPEAVSIVEE
ncbi:S1C family serine protease [Anaeroselena agilis]|uniref:Serine protease n=1 Tax=Anaeroselena agilis TaxID=3063788 RepID=A0ABU3NYZ0_9FIRM|nr:serine protease [Selenomonadales bacterium 4137-cl]